jgi:hypothetical protein
MDSALVSYMAAAFGGLSSSVKGLMATVTDKTMSDRSKTLEGPPSGESSLSQLYKNGPSATNGEDAILRAGKPQF